VRYLSKTEKSPTLHLFGTLTYGIQSEFSVIICGRKYSGMLPCWVKSLTTDSVIFMPYNVMNSKTHGRMDRISTAYTAMLTTNHTTTFTKLNTKESVERKQECLIIM